MTKKNTTQKERAISYARVFFTSMVLLLQLAVFSAQSKGKEIHWIGNITTPPIHRWVWGSLALAFLILAIIALLTAYSDNLAKNKLGKFVEKSFGAGAMMALTAVGVGFIQGFASAKQAGLDEWYVWVILILGLAFYIMYAVFPAKDFIAENVKRLNKTVREFLSKRLRGLLNRGV
jgi:ABC-type Fe3+ transport system permease subunit